MSIGRDAVSAGAGLSYVVVETVGQVAEFLDDLARHAEGDLGFQKTLEENRARRAAVLNAAKAPRAKPGPRTGKAKADE